MMQPDEQKLCCWNCGQEIIEADAGPAIGLYYFHLATDRAWCHQLGGTYATPIEPPRFVQTDRRVNRILWNERGKNIDEIVMHDAHVHIEQMNDRCWWIGIYAEGDDRYWMGNFVSDSRGNMRFVEQENAGIEWDVDQSHDEFGTYHD